MEIKAAIFDMDGTLINSLIFWDMLWEKLGRAYRNDPAFRPTDDEDRQMRTMLLTDCMALIHDRYGLGESAVELTDFANQLILELYTHIAKPKEGVVEFLEALRQKGVPMCVASATTSDLVQLALESCGIRQYFSHLLSCADLGMGKDRPDIYLLAASRLGTPVEDTWVFEDSLTAIRTAKAIGMKTAAIYDPCNYGAEEMAKLATVYIGPNETMRKLL